MLDPTQPGRTFVKWGLVTKGDQPSFVSWAGRMYYADTRQDARDFNHIIFGDRHKVVKVRFTVEQIK